MPPVDAWSFGLNHILTIFGLVMTGGGFFDKCPDCVLLRLDLPNRHLGY